MGLHNLAPAAARPDRNFNLFFLVFQKLLNLDSMSVSTQLAANEDGTFLPNTIPNCGGLVWFGLVGIGLVWLVYLCLVFIHRKNSIVKTPTQPQLNFSWVLHENGSAQSCSWGCVTGQEL